MKKLKCILSLPGDNLYLREQIIAAEAAARRLSMDLQVLSADMDPILQSQQLLTLVQGRESERPDVILLEPVNATGLPRVAEAAVAGGVAWVVSNAQVDYISKLRRNAKAPVFLVSQNHVEIGRLQGRQVAALLPHGGSVLYLRGPAMSAIATRRFEGIERGKPPNVEIKSLKVQGSTADNACAAVTSWLNLSTVRADGTHLIVSQNADFIFGARKAFESKAGESERAKWMAVPCLGAGVASQLKPLVDHGTMRAAVITSLTMDSVFDTLVQAIKNGSQPPERTFVEAYSYPAFEELAKKPLNAKP
ncbi:MAG: sugar ABC transporter substrate-binding protein [Candidatus Acidiferrales bacterium]